MSMRIFELKQEREAALTSAERVLTSAESAGRSLTESETAIFKERMSQVERLNAVIKPSETRSTLRQMVNTHGVESLLGTADAGGTGGRFGAPALDPQAGLAQASQVARSFGGWVNNALTNMSGGVPPSMEATASGPMSIGTGSGFDSVGFAVGTTVLPYLSSYYALDSFGLAGATVIPTDNTRPLVLPVLSAGALDSVFPENAAPNTSQPMGATGFTFGGAKYERLVLASYEALMNAELDLNQSIFNELLATLANTLTIAATTAFVSAMTGASSTLAVGIGGTGGSVYTSVVDLRHAVPPRYDLPTNKWMLSRATLAQIRNTRASTSGVPMFSPDGTTLLDRPYVINDALDTTSGAGVGFVAFGSFKDGAFLRRTPVMTRILQELYAGSGQVGFRTTQFADHHFLAELAGSAQPPTNQALYYSNVVSES